MMMTRSDAFAAVECVVLLSALLAAGSGRAGLRGRRARRGRGSGPTSRPWPRPPSRGGAATGRGRPPSTSPRRSAPSASSPSSATGYFQEIPATGPGHPRGRNVGARLLGSDPALARSMDHRLGPLRPPGRPGRRALPGGRRQRLGRRHDARGRAGDRPGARAAEAEPHVPRLRPGGDRPLRLALLRRAPPRPPGPGGPLPDGRHDRHGRSGASASRTSSSWGPSTRPGSAPGSSGRPAIARSRSACWGPTC